MPGSSGSTCCRGRSGYTIVALVIATAVSTTGWVATAIQRERAIAAAALPAEMAFDPVAPPPGELVEVLVAGKYLPVGTVLTREELVSAVKVKKLLKDTLPPTVVLSAGDLVGKHLVRPIRSDEPFTTQDVGFRPVHPSNDYDVYSLSLSPPSAAAGFVGLGSRVNVNVTLRVGNRLEVFPLLVNVLVVAVDVTMAHDKKPNAATHVVSFEVTEKQALVMALARSRGCHIELLLRHPNKNPEADKNYNLDEVIKLLSDEKLDAPAKIEPAERDMTPPSKPASQD